MENICLVDCWFQCVRPIRSLPFFHGARWTAWLRFAAAAAGMDLAHVISGILPLRHGRTVITEGECVALRLLVPPAALPCVPPLVQAMFAIAPQGEFSASTFRFLGYHDAVGGTQHEDMEPQKPLTAQALTPEHLAHEAQCLQALPRWQVHVISPMRLTLPAGCKDAVAGRERYCSAAWFTQHKRALAHLLNHVRFQSEATVCCDARLLAHKLHWVDMRYSALRGIALGGVAGTLYCEGRLDAQSAQRLVLGQYLGAGKNARFGLGFWRIPELDSVRRISLPSL